MNLTDNMKARILHALRTKDVTRVDLAAELGLGKAWATKLLKPRDEGGLKTLSDEQVEKLEEILGIQFLVISDKRKKVSGAAVKLSEMAEEDPALSGVLDALIEMSEGKIFGPRYFTPKEMSQIGNKIIRLAYANEDKPGKVAREVLKLVSS